MSVPFKVVGKYKPINLQKSWDRGKPGTQAKKATYINESDYLKYSTELLKRWVDLYDVEVFKMVDSKWVLI